MLKTSSNIHPTAIIDDGAQISSNVKIGPYCIVGPNVVLEEGVVLKSHVCVDGKTTIGQGTVVYPFASLGQAPQDLKYAEEESSTIIGENCTIREYVTIQRGTKAGKMKTTVGNNCLLMVGVHVAHDCIVQNNVVMANYVSLAGHVHVEENVVIGGMSAIQQYTRIGRHAMIGGMSGVDKDVIPYGLVSGERACLTALNLVGLRRYGYENSKIMELQDAFKSIFKLDHIDIKERISEIKSDNELVVNMKNFMIEKKTRPICMPKKIKS